MKIQILIDNPDSWIIPFAKRWVKKQTINGIDCSLVYEEDSVSRGDILCLLGCERKFKSLHLNQHNLVVHESALPHGRGMSPLTWQVIEGKCEIPVSLIEASEEIDAGLIYDQAIINLNGTELVEELRILQAKITFDLISNFIHVYPNIHGVEQVGEPTIYRKRTRIDSQLDINESIANQFNLLRVVDNDRYPAWFDINGCRYEIKITKKLE